MPRVLGEEGKGGLEVGSGDNGSENELEEEGGARFLVGFLQGPAENLGARFDAAANRRDEEEWSLQRGGGVEGGHQG